MEIFISWSGDRSKQIADAIRGWLPLVIQSVKPWMSNEDISAGSRWLAEISNTLNSAKVGLICVTPENQHNPWLLFEAGALSKTLEQTCVCPIVFDMTPGQLSGPLTQFQANSLDRLGIGKVLSTINNGLQDRKLDQQQLESILNVWWPQLEAKLSAIPPMVSQASARTVSDQLEELLGLARENMRRENLRLEGSRERDDKLDDMLGFMEKVGGAMGAMQQTAQKLMSASQVIEHGIEGSPSGTTFIPSNVKEINEAMRSMLGASAGIGGVMDVASLNQMVQMLKDIQVRDKERLASMLSEGKGAGQVNAVGDLQQENDADKKL